MWVDRDRIGIAGANGGVSQGRLSTAIGTQQPTTLAQLIALALSVVACLCISLQLMPTSVKGSETFMQHPPSPRVADIASLLPNDPPRPEAF